MSLKPVPIDLHYIFYIILGVLCGLLGSLFIHILTRIVYLRARLRLPLISDRWMWCLIVALIHGLLQYPVDFLKQGDKKTINQMFSPEPLQLNSRWNMPAVGFNLIIFCCANYILTILAMSATIPAGLPYCVFGAAFGRLYAYILGYIFPGIIFQENLYAIIASAAFISSVTKTISIAIIVFEMNQELTHMIPTLICVLVAYAVTNSLSLGIFDVMTDMRNLPYLPVLKSVENYQMEAKDIMNKNFLFLV